MHPCMQAPPTGYIRLAAMNIDNRVTFNYVSWVLVEVPAQRKLKPDVGEKKSEQIKVHKKCTTHPPT